MFTKDEADATFQQYGDKCKKDNTDPVKNGETKLKRNKTVYPFWRYKSHVYGKINIDFPQKAEIGSRKKMRNIPRKVIHSKIRITSSNEFEVSRRGHNQ
ncbi:MAG: hypothetical protein KAW12_07155 [Candidatus Aminicenantes bacterium]|nr:hypothetical protein [Candidatus Aminicenantes bacterium]